MPYYNAADMRARASDAWHSEWISKRGLKARFWTDIQPADLYFMSCSVHKLCPSIVVSDVPDFAVTTRQTHQFRFSQNSDLRVRKHTMDMIL